MTTNPLKILADVEWTCDDPDDRDGRLFCPCCGADAPDCPCDYCDEHRAGLHDPDCGCRPGLHADTCDLARAIGAPRVPAPQPVRKWRHLHETGAEHALCGLYRPASNGPVVHVSKARSSDCVDCRAFYRARIRDLSGRDYQTRAEQREG